MPDVGHVLVRIGADVSGLEAGLAKSSGAVASFGNRMNKLGRGLTKWVTVPVLAIGAASAVMATRFQDSMTLIQTQAGGSARDVKQLSSAVLDLAKHSQEGPNDLAKALYHLKSVGMDNAKAMDALHRSSQLAAVGNASLEETTNAVAGTWKSGITGAQDFGRAVGTLNAIIGAGNMRMEDLNGAMGTGIATTAKTFGVSLTSMGAGLALLTAQGQPAEASATRLRMAISLMGAPSDASAKALKSIGLSSTDLAKALRQGGLVAAIGELREHFKGLSQIQISQVLSKAFGGARSGGTIMALVQGYDGLIAKQKQIEKLSGKFGDAVSAQAQTASAKWHHFLATLEAVGVQFGDVLLPALDKVADDLGDAANWLGGLSEGTREWIVKIALAAAAFGPVLVMISKALALALKLNTALKISSLLQGLSDAGEAAGAAEGGAAAAAGGAAIIGATVAATVAVLGIDLLALKVANDRAKSDAMTRAQQTGVMTGAALSGGGYEQRHQALEKWMSETATQHLKPVTQELQLKASHSYWDTAHRMFDEIAKLQAAGKKGIDIDFSGLAKKGPEALRNLRTQLMTELQLTGKEATQMMNDVYASFGGKGKLDFKLPKAQTPKNLIDDALVGKQFTDAAVKGQQAFAKGLLQGQGPTRQAAASLSKSAVPKTVASLPVGKLVGVTMGKGMDQSKSVVIKSAAALSSVATPHVPDTTSLGLSIGAGLVAGMNASADSVSAAADDLAAKASAALHAHIKNPPKPSRMAMEIGQSVGDGLAAGMDRSKDNVVKSATMLAVAAASALNGALGKKGAKKLQSAADAAGSVSSLVDFITNIGAQLAAFARSEVPTLMVGWKANVKTTLKLVEKFDLEVAREILKAFPYTAEKRNKKGDVTREAQPGKKGQLLEHAAELSGPLGELVSFVVDIESTLKTLATSTMPEYTSTIRDSAKKLADIAIDIAKVIGNELATAFAKPTSKKVTSGKGKKKKTKVVVTGGQDWYELLDAADAAGPLGEVMSTVADTLNVLQAMTQVDPRLFEPPTGAFERLGGIVAQLATTMVSSLSAISIPDALTDKVAKLQQLAEMLLSVLDVMKGVSEVDAGALGTKGWKNLTDAATGMVNAADAIGLPGGASNGSSLPSSVMVGAPAVSVYIGTVYATNPQQAAAAGTAITQKVVSGLATATRRSKRGGDGGSRRRQ